MLAKEYCHIMRLPWQAREYERTCEACGCTWRVPRAYARRHVQSISGFLVAPTGRGSLGGMNRTELNTEIQSGMAISEQRESFRHCPKCGSDRYTQHSA